MKPILDAVLEHVEPAPMAAEEPLQLQVATLDYSDYLGRIAIGRIKAGTIEKGMRGIVCRRDGSQDKFRVTRLMGFRGLEKVDTERSVAGQIVALAGIDKVTVGETICQEETPVPLPVIPIDQPTITMRFMANTSPFAGREGQYVTSRQVYERLMKETEHNVGLRVETTERADSWSVSGRGTLHLSVLIETMRREGYELGVGQPQVVVVDGEEPWEDVTVNVPEQSTGVVIEKLTKRCGVLMRHEVDSTGLAQLEFQIPSRGLIGYRSEFLTDTRGEGILYQAFARYGQWCGDIQRRENGVLVVQDSCDTGTYGLHGLQERGTLLMGAGVPVYAGQVVGIHARSNDLVVNPGKKKQLTNIRAAAADDSLRLTPPWQPTLEQAIELIQDDELVEITPESIRIRKRTLDHPQSQWIGLQRKTLSS